MSPSSKLSVIIAIAIMLQKHCFKAQTGENMKELLTKLFKTNNYNKQVRPSLNQSKPLRVDLDLFLVAINGIDEVTQKLTTTGFLDIYWTDEYLTWNPADYGKVNTIYVSQNDIWKPDISLQNGFKKLNELGSGFIKVIISNDGSLRWSPFEVFETKCEIDITNFPFDVQTCDIVFVVWSYSTSEIKISKGSKGINFYQFKGNGEWEVVSTSATVEAKGETQVQFSLKIRRIPTFYLINVVAPVILLAILNVFTYVLPIDCGEKMSYSITVYLSFAVFLSIVSSTLPKTSGSLLEYYLIFQLGMGTIVVIITAVELRLHFNSKPVPKWLKVVFGFSLRSWFRKKRHRNTIGTSDVTPDCNKDTNTRNGDAINSEVNGDTDISRTDLTWSDITARLDMILFWCSLLLVIIMTLIIYFKLSRI